MSFKSVFKKTSDGIVFFFRELIDYIRLLIKKFTLDFGFQRASSLAYSSFLSLVPIVLLAFAILQGLQIGVVSDLEGQLERLLTDYVLPAQMENLMGYIESFREGLAGASWSSGLSFLFLGIFLMISLENHLNAIWKVERTRKITHAIVSYWAVLTIGPILIAASIILSQQLKAFSIASPANLGWLSHLTSFIFIGMTITLINKLLPNLKVKMKAALIGGFFSALFFELFRSLFNNFSSLLPHNAVYGPIAIIFLFLIYIFITWIIILLGTEVAYFVHFPPVQKKVRPSRKNIFTRELSILFLIVKEYSESGKLIDENLIQRNFPKFQYEEIDHALDSLLEHRLITFSDDRGYIPFSEPASYSLGEIISKLLGFEDDRQNEVVQKLKEQHPEIYKTFTNLQQDLKKSFPESLLESTKKKKKKSK